MKKILVLVFILLLPICARATSPCTTCTYPGAGNNCGDADASTFCAESTSLTHVQSAVTTAIAAHGNVIVYLPAGSSAWGGRLNIDTNGTGNYLRLIGYGVASTLITSGGFDIPSDRKTNFTEWGHMSIDGSATYSLFDAILQPETDWNELYWHDLVITGAPATTNYTITLFRW